MYELKLVVATLSCLATIILILLFIRDIKINGTNYINPWIFLLLISIIFTTNVFAVYIQKIKQSKTLELNVNKLNERGN